jgi:hypothetical protein
VNTAPNLFEFVVKSQNGIDQLHGGLFLGLVLCQRADSGLAHQLPGYLYERLCNITFRRA